MFNRGLEFFKNNSKELFVVFILLYFSNDTLLFGTNDSQIMFVLQFVGLIFLLCFLLFWAKKIQKRSFYILMVFIILISCTSIINFDFSIKYPYELLMVFIGLMVVQCVSFKKFNIAFCFWVEVFCVFSIILFLLASFLPQFINFLPVITNESGIRFHFVIFGFIEELGFSSVPRVFGVFREPGVYMIFISLAMIFETIMSDRFSIVRILIYITTILITFSTAAYISLGLILLLIFSKYIKNRNFSNVKKLLVLLAGMSVISVLFVSSIGYEKINSIVFNKLRVDNVSYDSRVGSFYANFRIFCINPIFGKGFTFFELNFSNYSIIDGFEKAHNTNTFLKVLSVHGIFYCFLMLFGSYKLFKANCKNFVFAIGCFIIYIVLFSDEDLMVNTLIYTFVCYGLLNHPESMIYESYNTYEVV